jgi:hypothetical protein
VKGRERETGREREREREERARERRILKNFFYAPVLASGGVTYHFLCPGENFVPHFFCHKKVILSQRLKKQQQAVQFMKIAWHKIVADGCKNKK